MTSTRSHDSNSRQVRIPISASCDFKTWPTPGRISTRLSSSRFLDSSCGIYTIPLGLALAQSLAMNTTTSWRFGSLGDCDPRQSSRNSQFAFRSLFYTNQTNIKNDFIHSSLLINDPSPKNSERSQYSSSQLPISIKGVTSNTIETTFLEIFSFIHDLNPYFSNSI